MNNTHEPSEPTYKAIGHCREAFALTRGVSRNAIDQLCAGNTHDPYIALREWFRDVCATDGANPEAYLSDMQMILQRYRPVKGRDVCEAMLETMVAFHKKLEAYTDALADGELDKTECLDLEPKIRSAIEKAETLLQSVIERKNALDGHPAVRQFAKRAANGRGKG
jgi:hypothetical protein